MTSLGAFTTLLFFGLSFVIIMFFSSNKINKTNPSVRSQVNSVVSSSPYDYNENHIIPAISYLNLAQNSLRGARGFDERVFYVEFLEISYFYERDSTTGNFE